MRRDRAKESRRCASPVLRTPALPGAGVPGVPGCTPSTPEEPTDAAARQHSGRTRAALASSEGIARAPETRARVRVAAPSIRGRRLQEASCDHHSGHSTFGRQIEVARRCHRGAVNLCRLSEPARSAGPGARGAARSHSRLRLRSANHGSPRPCGFGRLPLVQHGHGDIYGATALHGIELASGQTFAFLRSATHAWSRHQPLTSGKTLIRHSFSVASCASVKGTRA